MNQEGFEEYSYFAYGRKNGTANSYITAIHILDNIFSINDVFSLKGKSLTETNDAFLLQKITEFVSSEEKKFKSGEESIFKYGSPNQSSYPRGRFCSAAMKHLQRYQTFEPKEIEANAIVDKSSNGKSVSTDLLDHFDISKEGKDQISKSKIRIGQAYFRKMIISIYAGKCCITGMDVQHLLRASHIVPWYEDKDNRMNPENGLCLSGTYDLAFDQHLISFDEEYRMIVGKEIRDHFSNDTVRQYFKNYEGERIALPSKFLPSQTLLQLHRELLH